jgi:hypothetical protein
VIQTVPAIGNDSGCCPYIEILRCKDDKLLYTSRADPEKGGIPIKNYDKREKAM